MKGDKLMARKVIGQESEQEVDATLERQGSSFKLKLSSDDTLDPELRAFCEEITSDIKNSYEMSITIPEAERLAGKFLYAMLVLSESVRQADLNSRMRKSGVKAIRAAIYLEAVQKSDKKPSDVLLEQMINSNPIVASQQEGFDTADVNKDFLQNVYNVSKEAHVHFRTIAKQQG